MATASQTFWVVRRGHRPEEYEDAFASDDAAGRYAVADGDTESCFAGLWARLLAEGFVRAAGAGVAPIRFPLRWPRCKSNGVRPSAAGGFPGIPSRPSSARVRDLSRADRLGATRKEGERGRRAGAEILLPTMIRQHHPSPPLPLSPCSPPLSLFTAPIAGRPWPWAMPACSIPATRQLLQAFPLDLPRSSTTCPNWSAHGCRPRPCSAPAPPVVRPTAQAGPATASG